MRWPLRNQILLPMAAVVLTTLLGASALTALLTGARVKAEIERQLRQIGRTISDASFPLTERVLDQMHGLSGAEFVVADSNGRVRTQSGTDVAIGATLRIATAVGWEELTLSQATIRGNRSYFHAALRLPTHGTNEAAEVLHILYPQDRYRRAWWDAVWPPLLVGVASLVVTVGLGFWVAARAGRPLAQLHRQVAQIADGNFAPLPLPTRNDELRDLAVAVNRMAEMLARYEADIRKNERLRALAQLSGGIAHQLRNSATGCRMALDLHAAECSAGKDCESLEVAKRQLDLMEKYVQRFLTVGKPRPELDLRPLDLAQFVDELLPLVRPAAQHAGVELRWRRAESPVIVRGDVGELEQLVLNLLLNALEAAARPAAGSPRFVDLACEVRNGAVRLIVADSGCGPDDAVRERIFEPFVSEKRDGVGLGLAVAQDVASRHGGHITWNHDAGRTTFCVEFPNCPESPRGS